jgi:hypothetical protein
MPDSLETRIQFLTAKFAAELAHEIRANFAAQVATMITGGALPERRGPGRPKGSRNKVTATATMKRTYPPHCLFCNKPHGGPRTSFTCADHHSESKTKKRTALAEWKAKQAA